MGKTTFGWGILKLCVPFCWRVMSFKQNSIISRNGRQPNEGATFDICQVN